MMRPPLRTAFAVTAALVALLGLVAFFFIKNVLASTPGETAAALGGVLGGLVGAGGAVWAVYLAISGQRAEETAHVRSAVRTEVLSLVKYVIGALDTCIRVQEGLRIPRQEATCISEHFAFEPVIYSAVADRVGLLPHPEATVGFYMRIAEAKAMLKVLAGAPAAVSQSRSTKMLSRENRL
jgi:hypothetical protein